MAYFAMYEFKAHDGSVVKMLGSTESSIEELIVKAQKRFKRGIKDIISEARFPPISINKYYNRKKYKERAEKIHEEAKKQIQDGDQKSRVASVCEASDSRVQDTERHAEKGTGATPPVGVPRGDLWTHSGKR